MSRKPSFKRHLHNFLIIVGIVLMWRGIWYILDRFDAAVFGGSHLLTAILGIAIGTALIYLLDWELEDVI